MNNRKEPAVLTAGSPDWKCKLVVDGDALFLAELAQTVKILLKSGTFLD